MMLYGDFAFSYDALNTDADYDKYLGWVLAALREQGIYSGILADLGCGTGECSLRLARAGYDMIAVDGSAAMLSVFREKLDADENAGLDILVLQQRLEDLDLYGTIRGAVSAFDTLNHLSPGDLEQTLEKVSLFMEPGGVFVFDANTPYKHRKILGSNCFELEGKNGIVCYWDNHYNPSDDSVRILLVTEKDGVELACEEFTEYAYAMDQWERMLNASRFHLQTVFDGETGGPINADSQRYMIVAVKQ